MAQVVCFYCKQNFWINCDCANLDFEKLIWDCWELLKEKKYMHIVVSLCMAYEIFFSTYIYYVLIVKPIKKQKKIKREYREFSIVEQHNFLSKMLYDKIKTYTYGTLMSVFIKLILDQLHSQVFEMSESQKYIDNIKSISVKNLKKEIKNSNINTKLKGYLLALVCLQQQEKSISYLRNNVVHKYAYRPTLVEVERELKIAEILIFGIRRNINFRSIDLSLNT